MSIFLRYYPEEQRAVGKILTSYADLEYLLCTCLGEAINDISAAVRALFRLRGGNTRLQVADALLRPAMDGCGLKDSYDAALGAFRYSTSIRNQYAHCHWVDAGEGFGLFFTDLEKAAKTSTISLKYSMRHIDITLLMLQIQFLDYTRDSLFYLKSEFELRAGRRASHDYKVPLIIERPPLHNRREAHQIPDSMKAYWPPPEEPLPEGQPED